VTKTFTIALFACAISSAAISAQQKDQQKDQKDKSGTYSQPAEQQPLVMPAGQRPEEWKFQKEKEAEGQKAVEDKKAAKKKAEEDKKAAAEARKKAEADRKLASKLAREEAEKKRADERRSTADQKKAVEQQRVTDARAEREAAVAKRAEEQKAADERRALERRLAAEKAAEDVREKEAAEAAKKAGVKKSAAQKPAPTSQPEASAPPVAVASPAAPAAAPASTSTAAPAPAAPVSSAAPKSTGSQAAPAQKPAGDPKPASDAKSADGDKPAVDAKRPPAVIRAGEQPDAWKMQSEKPRAEGAAGQDQTSKGKSDTKSASTATGQTKPSASTPPKPKEPWRGWSDRALISLNAGWQAASFDLRDTIDFEPPVPGDREKRTLAADYSVKSGVSLDLGGAFRVWRALAAGVSVTRFEDSRDVPVSGSVPHPFFFNRARAVTGMTSGARQEMAVHVDAMWVVPIRPKMTLAVFGGPSFYSVKQTVVSDYDYNQSYPYDDVTLTRVITSDESSSVTGVNFGVDVGYYFTETIGVGGLIRFGRASVDTSIGSIDVGGPEFGVGLRIRIPQGRTRPRAVTPQPPPSTPR
jgi:hypothetical protein